MLLIRFQVHWLKSSPQLKAMCICLYLYSSTPIWGTPWKAALQEGGSQDVADREIKTSPKKRASCCHHSLRPLGPLVGRTCPPTPSAPTHKSRETRDKLNDGFIGKKRRAPPKIILWNSTREQWKCTRRNPQQQWPGRMFVNNKNVSVRPEIATLWLVTCFSDQKRKKKILEI